MKTFYSLPIHTQNSISKFLIEIERYHDWNEYYKQFIDNKTEEIVLYVQL